MSEQQNRDALERYFEDFERRDLDAFAELFHDDYVEEYPQSRERIRGKQNTRAVNENYPGLPSLINRIYNISGDLCVTELTLEYDGDPCMPAR